MSELLEILTGGGVLGILAKFAYDVWKQHQADRKHFSDQFKNRGDVYQVMNEVLQSTSARRFLVFRAHNGGGRPKLGAVIYSTCIYEDFIPPFQAKIHDFHRVLLDREYIQMMRRLITDDHVNILPEKMQPGELLKDIYETEGVAFSQVFYLHETREAFYYCSIATDANGMNEMASQAEQLKIRLAVGKLRDIFKKMT